MLKPEVENRIKSIASDFMKIEVVKSTKPQNLNPNDEQHHVPLHKTYIGLAATATLYEIQAGAKKEYLDKFFADCKNFLVESILQIQARCDITDPVHELVQCLLPSNAAALIPPSLGAICQKLPYLKDVVDLSMVDMEWRQHAFEDNAKSDLQWSEYWLNIRDAKTSSGEPKYQALILAMHAKQHGTNGACVRLTVSTNGSDKLDKHRQTYKMKTYIII